MAASCLNCIICYTSILDPEDPTSSSQDAVDAMVAKTHVLLNTAGPFALYGSPIVDACVRCQTHSQLSQDCRLVWRSK